MVYNFFDKKSGSVTTSKKRSNLNEFAQKLHKPVIENFRKRKEYERFKNNIWATDLGKTKPLPSKNLGGKYLLCVVDVRGLNLWREN